MTEHPDLCADHYDHLPDGTILGKIPYDDADKLITLCQERMTPEVFKEFTREFVRFVHERDPEGTRRILQDLA